MTTDTLQSDRLFHTVLIVSTVAHLLFWAAFLRPAESMDDRPKPPETDIRMLLEQLSPETPEPEPETPRDAEMEPIQQIPTRADLEADSGAAPDAPPPSPEPLPAGQSEGAATPPPSRMASNPFSSTSEATWEQRLKEAEAEMEARLSRLTPIQKLRFGVWTAKVHDAIQSQYFVPSAARYHKMKGKILVRVTVKQDGSIHSMEMLERSHAAELNAAAKIMIKRAGPLPSLEGILDFEIFAIIVPIIFDPALSGR
jgi:TonB family protein